MSHRIFVYGTLKSGNAQRGLDLFLGSESFVGHAITTQEAYDMYSLGDFPAVVLGGDSKIDGEVWEVDDEMFGLVDNIESYPELYNRKIIPTTAGDAWIYHIEDIESFTSEPVEPDNDNIIRW